MRKTGLVTAFRLTSNAVTVCLGRKRLPGLSKPILMATVFGKLRLAASVIPMTVRIVAIEMKDCLGLKSMLLRFQLARAPHRTREGARIESLLVRTNSV